MIKDRRLYLFILSLLLCLNVGAAQRFFNLTNDEVRVDSVLPLFSYTIPLGDDYGDSVYTATIKYPEFVDMTTADISNYNILSDSAALPALPSVMTGVSLSRKQPALRMSFCPLVYRDGKYQILVSFMLQVESTPKAGSTGSVKAKTRAAGSSRYASSSVLSSGRWVKIRIPSSGVYQLSSSLIRQAGFSDASKVKLYGYGGRLQNETLTEEDLIKYDDLKEVPTCTVNGRRLFYGVGPVTWDDETTMTRRRNPYSDYGYYFLTESDDEPATVDSAAFLSSFYPSANDYHTLYEHDEYAWFQGGRNLFDRVPVASGSSHNYIMSSNGRTGSGRVCIALTAGVNSTATVALNDSVLGSISVQLVSYDKGHENSRTFSVGNIHPTDTITVTTTSGGPVRLDYISMTFTEPQAAPDLASASIPVPEYVYAITNQNHHADPEADMVIIIPTSQKLLTQAQRLADFHEAHDSLRVNIVPADELYNEFSSGTPDANAYRRYLKMLYDRAESEADMPKYLLLFGDCVWDNRMLTSDCSMFDPDDYLLAFESENSFNEITCYVDDGFFCLLDDGEGGNPQSHDQLDMAVGRFPVTTEAEAKVMVDKTISYVNNQNAGSWENTLMFMGDDGNYNLHMDDVNDAADDVDSRYPGYIIKKVMWDAYQREVTSTGNRYPEVSNIIKKQQAQGALIMDYAGHGVSYQISHESVLTLLDFQSFTNTNLPLWITASCDIMPFDGTVATIGEAAVLNSNGGAVAFFGTTRTVYANYNKRINMAYLRYVLGTQNGKAVTIGEAQRLAKNYMITSSQDLTTNKLQYSLLGDPAIALNRPADGIVIDSINGIAVGTGGSMPRLSAGSVARIKGHIDGGDSFNGTATAMVRDSRELITCRLNDTNEASTAFTYYDRTKTIYNGTDSVKNGKFEFSFTVPVDINYSDESGLIDVFAVSNDHSQIYHGCSSDFTVGGTDSLGTDSLGPKIYCYLNSPYFTDGGEVNVTPYFVAELSDDDGINATGNGTGHDLELIVDGKATMTYNLNDNFSYDFGTYTSGSTYYSLPELEPGKHTLKFRAWDVLNNSSTATLSFTVVSGLEPQLFDVNVTDNPASSSTTFIISTDRMGSSIDVEVQVFDMSGRLLWNHNESGVSGTSSYTVSWDLSTGTGLRLPTGVYLYRVQVSSDGSSKVSKAKKLVIIGNN